MKIIVEAELRNLSKYTNSIRKNIWEHWANEVVQLFKSETPEIYYVPYHIVDGKVIQASGMFHNRLITHRRLLSPTNKRKPSTSSESSDSGVNSTGSKRIRPLPETSTALTSENTKEFNSNANDCIDWLRGSSSTDDLVTEKWLITFELRNK